MCGSGERGPAGVRRQPLERAGVPDSGSTSSAKLRAPAALDDRLGQLADVVDERVGSDQRLAGGLGEVPAVEQELDSEDGRAEAGLAVETARGATR